MKDIEAYKNTLQYINDIAHIETNIDSIIESENQEVFEDKLRALLSKLSKVKLHAAYYDNHDYTSQNLMVESGVQAVDFPEKQIKIIYDYAFTSGMKLSCCCSMIEIQKQCYEVNEAKELIEKAMKGVNHE